MAQLNITLNQEEILHLLQQDRDGAFCQLLQRMLNQVILAESQEQIGADRYERSEGRQDSRNGVRSRPLKTSIGKIILDVPRHRNKPFVSLIFDNYCRSDASLICAMVEMVVAGVSTRKVSKVVETLCGESFSKSTVSELCKKLDEEIEAFRNRKIDENYPFLLVDGTYFKVRENHKVISKVLMVALGIGEDGKKSILGFTVKDGESNSSWQEFFGDLEQRGLKSPRMVTSDAHKGILYGLGKVYPQAPWQRCQYHFTKDIVEQAPPKYQEGLRSELHELFRCETIEEARKKRDEIYADYGDIAEKAMDCLDNGFEDSMVVLILPEAMRKALRTSNHLERLNKELKRRSKVIGVFPNAASLLRLMGAVLMEQHDLFSAKQALFGKQAFSLLDEKRILRLKNLATEQRNWQRAA